MLLLPHICRNIHGLGSIPFARHYLGYRSFFLFLQVLRCFSSLRLPHLYRWSHAFNMGGCPIRISPDLVSFANPRSFSQLSTSFFALRSLGILHSPFVTSLLFLVVRLRFIHLLRYIFLQTLFFYLFLSSLSLCQITLVLYKASMPSRRPHLI